MIRAFAVLVALALLGASAHAVISHIADGYASPHAITTLALAAGIATGALAIGAALEQRRRSLALAIGIALLCAEGFGLVSTAERIIAQRDAVQSIAREIGSERTKAQQRLAIAEKAVADAGSSPRLVRAQEAKAAADNAVIAKSSERGCAANCRALLEQQVGAAESEIAAARVEIEQRRTIATGEAAKARAAADAIKPPASVTPLADRLGLEGWQLDLIVAALGSLAVNGLAAVLLVFAGHGHKAPDRAPDQPAPRYDFPAIACAATVAPLASPAKLQVVVNVSEHAAKFGIDCLDPCAHERASLDAIKVRYLDWCASCGVEPLPDATIGKALAKLFAGAGLHVEDRGAELVVVGVSLKQSTGAAPLLHAASSELMRVVARHGDNMRPAPHSMSFVRASS